MSYGRCLTYMFSPKLHTFPYLCKLGERCPFLSFKVSTIGQISKTYNSCFYDISSNYMTNQSSKIFIILSRATKVVHPSRKNKKKAKKLLPGQTCHGRLVPQPLQHQIQWPTLRKNYHKLNSHTKHIGITINANV